MAVTRLLAVGALAVAAVLVVVAFAGGGDPHTLRAGFDSAIQLTPGQEVRVAGRSVGEVGKISLQDGRALVELKVDDDDVWPLPKGTVARARYGSTTSYLSRYVELIPPPAGAGAGALSDGAILSTKETQSAFELDDSYNIFRGRTRQQTQRVLGNLDRSVGVEGKQLRRGLRAAPGGLDATAKITRELASDTERLTTLARAGDRTTSALAARSGALRELVTGAAGTFDALASQTAAQQAALDRAPRTFDVAVSTLARLDGSLDGLDRLVRDLEPGAPALRRFAVTARPTLRALRETSPLIASTLDRGTKAAPDIRTLLLTATPFLGNAKRALTGFAPQFACIRPYAPEIIGFLTTWVGQLKNFDATGHYARSFPLSVIPGATPGTTSRPKEVVGANASLSYALPRPPGLNAGKPWFLPECGVTEDALDPAKDPEAKVR